MQKRKKNKKKQTGKEKKGKVRERERDCKRLPGKSFFVFFFFSFILIQHFGCKNLQKSDKKSTKHNHACKYTERPCQQTNTSNISIILAKNVLTFEN